MKSIIDILNLSTEYLKTKGVSEPRLSAELIMTHVLNIERLDIYLQFDRILSDSETKDIRKLLKRRSEHEPIQYIMGEVEFFGLNFRIDNSVLIPRSDTEILVEAIAGFIGDRELSVLDIGTGSGCIAVSVAHSCPNIHVTATDISNGALNIAAKNAKLNGVDDRITLGRQDILKEIPEKKFDIIISNPPYISKPVIETLEKQVKDFEPLSALTDNNDGRTFYKRIREILPKILKPGGSVFLEIGYDQAEDIVAIFKSYVSESKIIKDLSGNDRVYFGKAAEV